MIPNPSFASRTSGAVRATDVQNHTSTSPTTREMMHRNVAGERKTQGRRVVELALVPTRLDARRLKRLRELDGKGEVALGELALAVPAVGAEDEADPSHL